MATPDQLTEETRAAAYRAQAAARLQFRRDLAAALAGDPVAGAEVLAGWQPVLAAMVEAHMTPLPTREQLQDQIERARRTNLMTKPGIAGTGLVTEDPYG